jgi:hypothetical protein
MIVAVGRCVSCNRFRRLGFHSDACTACLRRCTARFLDLARRVRNDPVFAAEVYRRLPEAWRYKFEVTFGRPPGA